MVKTRYKLVPVLVLASLVTPVPTSAQFPRVDEIEFRSDGSTVIREILDNEAVYGHTEKASSLADRSILLFGGWDDPTAPIETVVLPFYRALKKLTRSDVTIIAYHDGHFFGESRQEMASDLHAWLLRQFPR